MDNGAEIIEIGILKLQFAPNHPTTSVIAVIPSN
jgi:hypothetical protein